MWKISSLRFGSVGWSQSQGSPPSWPDCWTERTDHRASFQRPWPRQPPARRPAPLARPRMVAALRRRGARCRHSGDQPCARLAPHDDDNGVRWTNSSRVSDCTSPPPPRRTFASHWRCIYMRYVESICSASISSHRRHPCHIMGGRRPRHDGADVRHALVSCLMHCALPLLHHRHCQLPAPWPASCRRRYWHGAPSCGELLCPR